MGLFILESLTAKTMRALLFIFFVFYSSLAQSQNKIVEGQILAFNKYPLENIEISARKSKEKTTTDENGVFAIKVKEKDLIKINDPLFDKYEKKVGSETDPMKINLIFKESEKNIDEAIDNGYFEEEDLTYALRYLNRQNNAYALFSNVYEAIETAIPEARKAEKPDGSIGFIMRGVRSIDGDNSALIIVNNNIIEDISYIAPAEIKSINKLSNSQAALFGSRGGNGVISIITY